MCSLKINHLKQLFLFILTTSCAVLFLSLEGFSQGGCTGDVPSFTIDLTGEPEGSFSTPPTSRQGNCCGTTNPDNCIRFIITLDTNSVGINFSITGGAVPPGALFYQVDCGPQQTVGDYICITGPGPHVLTFCKPGNNDNVFTVTAVSSPLFPDEHTVREGCELLEVLGLLPETVEWNSIFPGVPSEYNNYLSCSSGCTDPLFTPQGLLPEFIDYQVCGFPQADDCGFLLEVCDTVRIYTADPLEATISPDPATYCPTADGVLLDADPIGGVAPFSYQWFDALDQPVGTDETFFATATGNYSVIVQDDLGERCGDFEALTNVSIANISLSFASTILDCFGDSNGSITATVTGGTPPYQYDWSNGESGSPTISNLTADTYSVTITDQGGCTAEGSVTLTQPQSLVPSASSPLQGNGGFNLACNGDENGSATVSATGGNPPYTYSWSNGESTETITGLAAGIYTVTVNDAAGCSEGTSITLTEPAPITLNLESPEFTGGFNISCFGGSNGSISAGISGGTSPFSFVWDDPNAQVGANPSGLAAGEYTVTVTDASNCITNESITLTQPTPLAVNIIASQDVLCFGDNTGSVTAEGSGGVTPFTYEWDTAPPQFDATATNLIAGNYEITLTDVNNCTTSTQFEIQQPENPITINISKTNVACFGDDSGIATAEAIGGTGVLSYTWNTIPEQTGPSAIGLTTGTYTVTVSDENNCSETEDVIITQPANALSGSIVSVTNILCFGDSTGSATALGIGGTPGYFYKWDTSPQQSGSTATGLSAGIYSVTITDMNGCEIIIPVEITEPNLPLSINLDSQSDVACFGDETGSLTVSATGGTAGYTYEWDDSNNTANATLSGIGAGDYTVTVTDANGCVSEETYSISEPPSPLEASITNTTDVLCFGVNTGTATVTATGGTPGYNYLWDDPMPQTTANATGLAAGTYQVTVTDANGCTGTVTATITQPQQPLDASIISQTNVVCFGNATGSATVQGSGGSGSYSYLWSPGGFTTPSASNLAAGAYTVTVSDNNGCTQPVDVIVNITQPAGGLMASLTTPTVVGGWNIACHGDASGSIDLEVTGGSAPYTYTWFEADGDTVFTQDLSNLIAGTYTVVIADQGECTLEQSITLTEPDPLEYTFTMTPSLCFGSNTGEIQVSVSGGTTSYNLSWEGPGGFTSSDANLTNLVGGIYELTVTDANGCTFFTTVTVTQPDDLVLTLDDISTYPGGWNVSCYAAEDGYIDVSGTGGTLPYSFIWQGPNNPGFSTDEDVFDIPGGTYEVILIDDNNCIQNLIVPMATPDSISILLDAFQYIGGAELSCPDASDGSITAIVDGGTLDYDYNWSGPPGFPGAITPSLSDLSEGTYVLEITDQNGCMNSEIIRIDPPDSLILSVSSPVYFGGTNLSCNGASDGSIQLFVEGGVAGYMISWDGPNGFSSSASDISDLEAGEYCATVSDANGCEKIICLELIEPEPLSTTLESPEFLGNWNIDCNGSATGIITTSVLGGTPPYIYSWDGPGFFSSDQPNLSNLEAGIYCVSISDANSCTFESCITLTEPDPLDLVLLPSDYNESGVSCADATDGFITASVSGGTETYTFNWTGPNGFTSSEPAISDLTAGNYCVMVTDANDCTIQDCIEITQPEPILINLSSPTFSGGYNINCFGNSSGSINSVISGGTPPYNYSWTGPDGYTSSQPNPDVLSAGVYCLEITDINNCTASNCIELTEPSILAMDPDVTGIACNSAATAEISLNLSGGTEPYTIIWGNGLDTEVITGLESGFYSVIVIDDNGCMIENEFEIGEPQELQVALTSPTFVGGNNIDCFGDATGSIGNNVNGGTAPYIFSWTGPDGFVSSDSSLTGLIAGTYCLDVIDANGCDASSCITLTEPNQLSVLINQTAIVLCNGDANAALQAQASEGNPGYTYIWDGPDGYTNTGQNIGQLIAGIYCVEAIDANGCTAQNCFEITEPDTLQISLTALEYNGGFNINCFSGADGNISSSIIGGSGDLVYSWTGPGTFTAQTPNIDSLIAGEYCLTVTDINNCAIEACITLTQPEEIEIVTEADTFAGGFNISCTGTCDGSAQVVATGGNGSLSYDWSGPLGFQSIDTTLTDLCAGNYFITVTDENNCVISTDLTLTEPEELLSSDAEAFLFPGQTNISCWGAADGEIDLSIAGGVSPYGIDWSGPDGFNSTDEDLNDLSPGTYFVTILDANDCSTTLELDLIEPDTLLFADIEVILPNCYGFEDGSIFSDISGGTPWYSFEWAGPNGFTSSFDFLENVGAGSYELQVTDTNGCVTIETILLEQPDSLFISGNVSDATCGASDGAIAVNVTGGTGDYDYLWNTDEENSGISNLPSATYTVTVTDENDCMASGSYEVGGFNPLELDLLPQNLLCYNDTTGELAANLTNAVPPIDYQWEGPDGFASGDPVLMDLLAGTYSLLVTDGNNCTATAAIEITQPDSLYIDDLFSPYPTMGIDYNVSTPDGSDGSITSLDINGGTPTFQGEWEGPNGFQASGTNGLNGLESGTYNVTVTDANGCSIMASITLTEPYELDLPNGISPNGDLFNDALIVRGIELYPQNELIVFNRWGNIVYQEDNYSNDTPWEGVNQNGTILPDGTYFVVVKINSGEARELNGYLEIRR